MQAEVIRVQHAIDGMSLAGKAPEGRGSGKDKSKIHNLDRSVGKPRRQRETILWPQGALRPTSVSAYTPSM
jgi:hypothetical protein